MGLRSDGFSSMHRSEQIALWIAFASERRSSSSTALRAPATVVAAPSHGVVSPGDCFTLYTPSVVAGGEVVRTPIVMRPERDWARSSGAQPIMTRDTDERPNRSTCCRCTSYRMCFCQSRTLHIAQTGAHTSARVAQSDARF
jgi:hypothetical protein